jgi:hypothetical protein
MNQKTRSLTDWEKQANNAAKFYEIPAAELKREIKRALTRIVAERIAESEIAERQKSSSAVEEPELSHIVESHYRKG